MFSVLAAGTLATPSRRRTFYPTEDHHAGVKKRRVTNERESELHFEQHSRTTYKRWSGMKAPPPPPPPLSLYFCYSSRSRGDDDDDDDDEVDETMKSVGRYIIRNFATLSPNARIRSFVCPITSILYRRRSCSRRSVYRRHCPPTSPQLHLIASLFLLLRKKHCCNRV